MNNVLPPAARCEACGLVAFPPSRWCPNCGGRDTLRTAALSQRGRLFEWTTVYSPAPGFEAPYRVGYVDLPEGVRLFGQIAGGLEADVHVGDTVDIVAPNGNGYSSGRELPYVFEISRANGKPVTVAPPPPEVPEAHERTNGSNSVAQGAAFIAGVGMTQFGRFAERRAEELAQSAIIDALEDAGVAPAEVDGVFVGHVFQGRVAGQRMVRDIGLAGRPIVNVENACASGASALHLAVEAVRSGRFDVALAVGVEQLSVFGSGVIPPDLLDLEGAHGRTNPATYALMAKRHMAEFGTTDDQLASVVVQARSHGNRNDRAQLRKLTTVEEVLASPPVATPLSRLQCCPTGDGAAAAVVVSERVARRLGGAPVRVRASVISGGFRRAIDDEFVSHPVTRATAADAYGQAGLGPSDIDVAEIHDAFSIAALVHLEDLGFYKPGEAGPAIAAGATGVDGEHPTNPSGGLLAKGHPLGATGIAQVYEIAEQFRGQAGDRQVSEAEVAVAHTRGGSVPGTEGGSCGVLVCVAD
jgi:acetyl-CoA acetyltransferase